MTPAELPAIWRDEAKQLRDRYGSPALAALAEAFATDLELALEGEAEARVSRAQAVREFDVSADHLSRLVRDGRLQNHGRPYAPSYRRGDLVALGLAPRPAEARETALPAPAETVPAPTRAAAGSPSLALFTRRVHARGSRG